jgi:hypothetical protein
MPLKMTKSRSSAGPGSNRAEPTFFHDGNEDKQIPLYFAGESTPALQEYLHDDFLALPAPGVPFLQYAVSNRRCRYQ